MVSKKNKTLALLSIITMFMALARTLAECLWLAWAVPANAAKLRFFLTGAITAAVFLFIMSVTALYGKHLLTGWLALCAVAVLLLIKITCNI